MTLNDELKTHFINLYSMALADEQIDTKELEMLYKIGLEKGISKEEMDEILFNVDIYEVEKRIPNDILTKVEYLFDFVQMIIADGIIDYREKEMLKKFCLKFGFIEDNINTIIEFLIEEAKKGTNKQKLIEYVKQIL
jgi:L-2-hydroxyglutarate oxidase LhgO